jgi:hypothetical protein
MTNRFMIRKGKRIKQEGYCNNLNRFQLCPLRLLEQIESLLNLNIINICNVWLQVPFSNR